MTITEGKRAALDFPHSPSSAGDKFPRKTQDRLKGEEKQTSRGITAARTTTTMCCGGECRPLGWLLGLPFAFLSLLVSLVGIVIWIVGLLLSCVCPCCLCVTLMVELAIELIKAPLHVMEWFTSQIPC